MSNLPRVVDIPYYPLALDLREGVRVEEVLGLLQSLKDQNVVEFYWRTDNSSIVFADIIGDTNYRKFEETLGSKTIITVLPKAQML